MISSSLFISVIIQDIWPTATTKSKLIERTTRTVWHPTKLKDKGLFLTRHRIPFDHVFVRLARKCYNNKLVWPFPVSWHRSIDVVNAKCTAYSYKMCPRWLERWDIVGCGSIDVRWYQIFSSTPALNTRQWTYCHYHIAKCEQSESKMAFCNNH